jgi:predicted dithiol-disulfide oxidoreductase (DUF899 family)
MNSQLTDHEVVSHEQWTAARKQLLKEEKEFTRRRDELSRRRRELPWERVDKQYVFGTPAGKKSLAELFGGSSQLIVYHFMLGPDWKEGCHGCSFVSDHFDGSLPHINARDVSFIAVSRAPLAKIESFKKRMGWKFPWVSSHENDFNRDYQVSFTKEEQSGGKVYYNYEMQEFPSDEAPGVSVFYRDAAGEVYHTYSSYGRGLDPLIGAYQLLDLVPKGRDEDQLDSPMAWVRHHDRYVESRPVELQPQFSSSEKAGACCDSQKERV